MSDTLQLGKIITTEQQRDAIHIAVAPVVATMKLWPGEAIGFVNPGDTENVGSESIAPIAAIGIVDPFLKGPVYPGHRFWMFLYPYTITSLRHDWTHPAFGVVAAKDPKAESEKWLRDFARKVDETYEFILSSATDFLTTGERYIQRDSETLRDTFWESKPQEFWKHFEVVTGEKVEDHKASPYCCAC